MTSSSKLRIAVTQRVEDLADRGERRDCLDQAFCDLLGRANMQVLPVPNRLSREALHDFLCDFRIDGVILSGGNDLEGLPGATNVAPERDELEKNMIELCAQENIPLLGICRGMQMLIRHYGGELQGLDREFHVATLHRLELLLAKENLQIDLDHRDAVNSFHSFGCMLGKEGEALQALAKADDGSIEAIRHGQYRQWGIMWHPERKPGINVDDQRDVDLIRSIFIQGK